MVVVRPQKSFAEEFERLLNETDTSVRRLSRLSGIPRRTLENWLYGRTQRPRHVEPLLQAAQAMHLPAIETNRLLLAAGYPTLEELKLKNHSVPPQLLQDWRVAPNILIGQKSAALPAQNNLPGAATPFLGREAMCEELSALLRRSDVRLVTVSGLGGAGKTRLALETARAMDGRFDHGVYFIPLDNVNNAEGFWEAIVNGLQIASDGSDRAQKLVEDYLPNKQMLLLLDNLEHLLSIRADLSRLLSTTQRVKLLVTSRQALDLQAEYLYPIGGLAYDDGQHSPAYQLFVQTAQRRVPGFAPSPAESEDILALCVQVDGLPLAIELAAIWSDVLNPAQILDHITRDLHDVWHSTADRPDRQKSLWDLFDYSWQMLPKKEQEAAMRLSVLRGSFSPSMAMAVAGCDAAVLKLLIQTSVVGHTSGSRLLLHPLVSQFLQQQAVRAGYNIEDLEDQFMEVTLAWTAAQSQQLRQTFKAVHVQNLHAEWQHIDRAWHLAVKHQRYALLESCWDILFYFEARGIFGQGDAFFEATRQQIPAANRRMQARLDEAQALMAARVYDMQRSVRLAQRSLDTLEDLGVDSEHDEAGSYARVIIFLADYALKQSSFPEEKKQMLKQVASGYLERFADVAIMMFDAVKYCVQNDFQSATFIYQEMLEMNGPDTYVNPNLLCFAGVGLSEQGQVEAAGEQFELALKRGLEGGYSTAVVSATYELQLLEGHDDASVRCREALEDLALQMGSRRTVGRVAIGNAIYYLNMGLFSKGTRLMRIGVGMVWNEGDNAERRRILSAVAQAYIAFGLIKHAPQILSLVGPGSTAADV